MGELDKYERDKWNKIRTRGRVIYAFTWILYLLLFFVLMQTVLILVNGKSVDMMDIAAMLFISIVLGIAISAIRWSVFDKQHKQ